VERRVLNLIIITLNLEPRTGHYKSLNHVVAAADVDGILQHL
jgi:hypothetical protein